MTDTIKGICGNSLHPIAPHVQTLHCYNWSPLPLRTEIWRYTHNTLTVCCTDGSAFNTPDSMFAGSHEGVWDSSAMRFVPKPDDYFSDGVPVALYEGVEP